MFRQSRHLLLTTCLAALPGIAFAAQGSCAHNEMRKWVDAEEICYHSHGPLSETWNIHDQKNQDTLTACLDTAKAGYVEARVRCDVRGESAYRQDGIHKDWEKYRQNWDSHVSRLRQGG